MDDNIWMAIAWFIFGGIAIWVARAWYLKYEDRYESARCYKCGAVRCETCGGAGRLIANANSAACIRIYTNDCPDCEGKGWLEAEYARVLVWETNQYGHRFEEAAERPVLGTDPNVVCSECKGVDKK